MTKVKLTAAQVDRAAGTMLGLACGDALGAGYEFGPALPESSPVNMIGGGTFQWQPGEWTDDTQMAICIAEVAATGADLTQAPQLDAVAQEFARWYAGSPKDVGVQTGSVLRAAGPHPTGAGLAEAAAQLHARTGHTAGNGSLMRTAPVALAYLGDPAGLVQAAMAVSALTHYDPVAGEACALWCLGIRTAVLQGTFEGVRAGLNFLAEDRAEFWAARLDEAEAVEPAALGRNGYVVKALQAAWSAIKHAPVPDDDPAAGSFACLHLQRSLEAAVRAGDDTDTVAAIAGALLGARWGASAVPAAWRRILQGWPGYRARDLIRLGVLTALGGHPDGSDWPTRPVLDYSTYPGTTALAAHPTDQELLLGGVDALRAPPAGVSAVVSLCRLGSAEVPAERVNPGDHLEIWLIDAGSVDNPNLDFVIDDTARAVLALRTEGHRVLLHCVQAESRTPAIAARYTTLTTSKRMDEALTDLRTVLPRSNPNPAFTDGLSRLSPSRSL